MNHNGHVCEWKDHCCVSHVMWHPAYEDKNYCTVRAMALAFNLSRVKAYLHLQRHGRRHGKGPKWHQYRAAVKAMCKATGRKMILEDILDYGKTVLTAQRSAANETVIFNVRGHTLAVVDGYTNDWADQRRNRITSIWRIS